MYCPNCAAPVDGMKFCRKCGANVSLVPQALTGHLPVAPPEPPTVGIHHGRHRRRRDRDNSPPSMETAGKEFFGGLGFLFVALAIWQFFPGGFAWWFWLLIPAFIAIGKGIGQYLAVREQRHLPPPQFSVPTTMPQAAPQPQLPVPTTSELKLPANSPAPPASVTEHTTALLDQAKSAKQEEA